MKPLEEYLDYRIYLRDLIDLKRQVSATTTYSRLADAIKVQRSYLSNVLGGRGNLSEDQLYLLIRELNLNPSETAYLEQLARIDRCQVPSRKKDLEFELDVRRQALLSSAEAIQSPKVTEEDVGSRAEYYADPIYPLVHMGFCLTQFQKKPLLLRDRLVLSVDAFSKAIDVLEKCGAIRVSESGYELLQENIHLGPQSSLAKVHALTFRLRAVEKYKATKDKSDYFFTASFTANEELRMKIRQKFLKILEELSIEIDTAACDEIYHLNIDLFRV